MLKRFEFDEDSRIDYTQNGDYVEFREANELLLEAYRAIVDNCSKKSLNGLDYCSECKSFLFEHNKDCIVLKAEKYISEVKRGNIHTHIK